jgi:hypothetical protein
MTLVKGSSGQSELNKSRGMVKPRNARIFVGEQRTRRSGGGVMFLVRCEAGFWERRAGGLVYMRWRDGTRQL